MSGSLFEIAFALVVLALAAPFLNSVMEYFRWRKLPTLAAYLAANPHCRTHRGIKCANCNSSSIKNWGLTGANDSDRKFVCNHCNTSLYRN